MILNNYAFVIVDNKFLFSAIQMLIVGYTVISCPEQYQLVDFSSSDSQLVHVIGVLIVLLSSMFRDICAYKNENKNEHEITHKQCSNV